MVVARRDPPIHVDAQDAPAHLNPARGGKSKVARFITVIQMVGSVLALPVGIGSAYSVYRANFSPQTTCQNLRNNIVSMLDKGVDAATRRILVRRDIEAFERTCVTVDPDATAAFKKLLANDRPVSPAVAAPAEPKTPRSEAASKEKKENSKEKEAPRKSESRPAVAAKAPANVPAPSARPSQPEAVSDVQWLDAVRQALLTQKQDSSSRSPELKPQGLPASAERAPAIESKIPAPEIAPAEKAPSVAPAAPMQSAPPLPPAASIAPQPAPQIDLDHPVPPESIPSPPTANGEITKSEAGGRSRLGKWISAIPLLGPVVDNGRH